MHLNEMMQEYNATLNREYMLKPCPASLIILLIVAVHRCLIISNSLGREVKVFAIPF